MAFRNDITVDWISSPRLITIGLPSLSLLLVDLIDTLWFHEGLIENMDELQIVLVSGNEEVDVGLFTGYVVTLLNAQIAFAARPGPAWVQTTIDGGSLRAVDTDGITAITPIFNTPFVTTSFSRAVSGTITKLEEFESALLYRNITNETTGQMELYDKDNVLAHTQAIFEDEGGTTPYGAGSSKINRRDKIVPAP